MFLFYKQSPILSFIAHTQLSIIEKKLKPLQLSNKEFDIHGEPHRMLASMWYFPSVSVVFQFIYYFRTVYV